jgi:oxygen-independent coproporphyrinogen III oxidase
MTQRTTLPGQHSTPSRSHETAGVYIHVPWCRSICTYCDFDRQAHDFELIPAYVEALVGEIEQQPRIGVHSIFLGGGTPSLLEPRQLELILSACKDHFGLSPRAEITVEANPGDLNASRVEAYLSAGMNRLSLGVQTFDDRLLRLLGRRHTASEAIEAYFDARRGGAANVSLDLMYGLPGQTVEHWQATLQTAVSLEPDHLSAYLLTVDETVPLGRSIARGRLSVPADDGVAEMYEVVQQVLSKYGYEQYEISNWARPGRQSRHNLTYWRDEPYLGLGAGSASWFGGRRYKQAPDPAVYIASVQAGQPSLVEDECPDRLTAAQDCLALGLRLREGLDLPRFEGRYGLDLEGLLGAELEQLEAAGVVDLREGRLRLGEQHLIVSNEVISRLHQALERALKAELSLPEQSYPAGPDRSLLSG